MTNTRHDKARAQLDALDLRKTISAIIDSRAWEALGFATFTKAWRVMHLNGRNEWNSPAWNMEIGVRAHLAWQFLAEGTPASKLTDLLFTEPGLAEVWDHQRANGVPPGLAAQTVADAEVPF